MKKKVLFIIPNHTHGGTNRSLQNIISVLDKEKYDIYIYSITVGGFYEDVFKEFQLSRGTLMSIFFCRSIMHKIFNYIDNKYFGKKLSNLLFCHEAHSVEKRISVDMVVAFQEGSATRLGYYFNSRMKLAWVQCDYSLYHKLKKPDLSIEAKLYSSYNKIVCVSNCTAMAMKRFFPKLSDRISFVYNLIDVNEVKKLSEEIIIDNCFSETSFTIVSIGRFSSVKRFSFIPHLVKEILNNVHNKNFKWFIIGPEGGGEYNKTKDNIIKYEVSNNVILLGRKDNPYPYIKRANLIVCLSESESWSYVLNEAILFHVPVLTTNFDAAYEVVSKENGIITDINSIGLELCKLINNTDGCYSRLKQSSLKFGYSNNIAISQLNMTLE